MPNIYTNPEVLYASPRKRKSIVSRCIFKGQGQARQAGPSGGGSAWRKPPVLRCARVRRIETGVGNCASRRHRVLPGGLHFS